MNKKITIHSRGDGREPKAHDAPLTPPYPVKNRAGIATC